MGKTSFGRGIIFAALAYFLWGLFPLYWRLLAVVDSLHILAFRILCSLVLVGILLFARKNTQWISVFKSPKEALLLIAASVLLSCNWGLFIWAVNQGHIIEASLGYYINPLVSIVLGLLFFRETLRPLQWAAVAIAFTGVAILTLLSGVLPWISLVLAFTFGFYGLVKKMLRLSALESLGSETLAAAPVGIVLLCFTFSADAVPLFSGFQNIAYVWALPIHTLFFLSLCGAVTMLPLYLFGRGAKLLPLSALGFTQFLAPTLQFLLGLFVFGEAFPFRNVIAFAFIWAAVITYVVSLKPATVKKRR